MDPVKKILGAYECSTCGDFTATQKHIIPLWDYGVRVTKPRYICKKCITAWKAGKL